MTDTHPSLQKYLDLLDRMRETAINKSHDYSGKEDPFSNLRQSKNAGIEPWKAVIIRLGDKYSRLCNFAKQNELKVKDESIEDTLIDNAVYSLLCLILYRESNEDTRIPD